MRLLIGTPAYGNMVTTDYLVSMARTIRGFLRDGVDYSLYALGNESLINRGRNTIANLALRDGYDKLLFIDADIGWDYNDVCRVLNTNKPIIGGVYPNKAFPLTLNFNSLLDHASIFEKVEAKGLKTYRKTVDKFIDYRDMYADKTTGEVEVMHITTGFMVVDVKKVFEKLKDKVANYSQMDFYSGISKQLYEFFPVGVKNGVLESEDWAFCSLAREAGIPVYLNTKVILNHTGSYTFDVKRGMA